jgi:serine/threonine protein kinase
MLHRLKHGSLTFYVAAFITSPPDEFKASVYVEFCDRGSLEDLIKAYQRRRQIQHPGPRLPERFLWHAFGGLCDGLAYLRGGRSYISLDNNDYSKANGWLPLLHRDIKPDNVLIRSRDTLGRKCYFYCVLSDFGLACEDYPHGHSNEDDYQKSCTKLGTCLYFAPELLYHPYPRTVEERRYFPGKVGHSEKSDLWSLAASIYCLAYLDGEYSHINMSTRATKGLSASDWQTGTVSRKRVLQVPITYSKELQQAVLWATQWDPKHRPGSIEMVKEMKVLMRKSGFTSSEWKDSSEEIPEWATKKHEYHAKVPLDPRKFGH